MTKTHTIHTKRLIIRSPQDRDAAAYLHLNTNPNNNKFDPTPPDKEKREHSLEKYKVDIVKWRAAAKRGEAAFMVVTLPGDGSNGPLGQQMRREDLLGDNGEVATDVVIGMTGFNQFVQKPKRIDGEDSTAPEKSLLIGDIGVLIDAPQYTNNGYAKEALLAVVEYGFTRMGCDSLTAATLAINTPFRALMKSAGFGDGIEEDGRDRHGKVVCEALYELTKDEWQRQSQQCAI